MLCTNTLLFWLKGSFEVDDKTETEGLEVSANFYAFTNSSCTATCN
jgi:hypothetical protein